MVWLWADAPIGSEGGSGSLVCARSKVTSKSETYLSRYVTETTAIALITTLVMAMLIVLLLVMSAK